MSAWIGVDTYLDYFGAPDSVLQGGITASMSAGSFGGAIAAGWLSDIFGRRYVILFGQLLTVIGGIVACTAKSMNQLIAGEVILGASIGTVSVAYAGESEGRIILFSLIMNRHIRDPAQQIPWNRTGVD